MKNELIVTVALIVLMFLCLVTGNAGLILLIVVPLVLYSMYCGYHSNGGKSYLYAVLPLFSFILFILCYSMSNMIANGLMVLWIIAMLAAAWYCKLVK